MRPKICDGSKGEKGTGKRKPVTLVSTVVIRKTAVHPSSRLPVSMPHTTIRPVPMPIRLSATCTNVKVWIVIPRTMALSHLPIPYLKPLAVPRPLAFGFPAIDKPAAAARHNTPLSTRKPEMSQSGLAKIIDDAFEKRDGVGPATKGEIRDSVDAALGLLDRGEARVAERQADGSW